MNLWLLKNMGKNAHVIASLLMVLPGCSPNDHHCEPRAQQISCINNLKQIGLSFRIWAGDNDDKFPFNVSTNSGGSLEFCNVGKDGFDLSSAFHFQVMSNELNTPKILICPEDQSRKPALDFGQLQSSNVTYLVRSGTNVSDANPKVVLAVCPIDGNIVYCDGTVVGKQVASEIRSDGQPMQVR